MPEIGLNGLLLDSPFSGTASYSRGLIDWLPIVAPDLDFRLFVRKSTPSGIAMPAERLIPPFSQFDRGSGPGARAAKLGWEAVALPLAAAAHRQAVLHSLYFAAPPRSPCPLVVTVHDLIPLLLPGYHRSRQAAWYSRIMARNVTRANAIVTVSQHAKVDIVRTLGVAPERITVTYEAVAERFCPEGDVDDARLIGASYGLPERFLLYIGGAERRKNIETVVRAWHGVRNRMRSLQVKLVVVAQFPPADALFPDIPALVEALSLQHDVVLVTRVAEEHKPALYRAALALCFPSHYEGFGLTPLEAMACGTPVLSSNAASLPEVVGSGGKLLPPDDIAVWGEEMVRLAESPELRDLQARRGLEQAAHFSWRATAECTARVYRGLLS